MLKQRVVTAILLTLVFLGVLFLTPPAVFVAFVSLIVLVAAWEWANFCGYESHRQRLLYLLSFCLTALLGWLTVANQWLSLHTVLLVSVAWWAVALLWVQGYPSSTVLWRAAPVRAAMGMLVLLPTWYALASLRFRDEGYLLILAIVLIVAAADVGAYFTGRAFGRHKLAPAVSPAKSWEGVVGGVLAATLTFGIFLGLTGAPDVLKLALIAIPTALVSVVGDLLESMLKRFRGIKDSSHILPGHGGVMDRVDGLLAAVPVFTLALLSSGWPLTGS